MLSFVGGVEEEVVRFVMWSVEGVRMYDVVNGRGGMLVCWWVVEWSVDVDVLLGDERISFRTVWKRASSNAGIAMVAVVVESLACFSTTVAFPNLAYIVPPSASYVSTISSRMRFFHSRAGPSSANVSYSPPSPSTAPRNAASWPPSVKNCARPVTRRALVAWSATLAKRRFSLIPPEAILMIRASHPAVAMSSSRLVRESGRDGGGGRNGYCQRYARGIRLRRVATDSTRVR